MRDLNKRVNPRAMTGVPKWKSHVLPQRNFTVQDLNSNFQQMARINSNMLPEKVRYPNIVKALTMANKLFGDGRLDSTIRLLNAGVYKTPKELCVKLRTFL